MKSPIFLFSLPRSGSTLLQRILMAHKDIASVAEPWLLLPFLYTRKKEGVLAEYSHTGVYTALSDFISNLPNKELDFNEELGKFVTSLYEKFCHNNEKYFLDKTPRYFYIIPEIENLFTDAKFIFLFRNPIQILSSIMQSWDNNSFKHLYGLSNDLRNGPELLASGYKSIKNKSIALNYEDLVSNPKSELMRICDYLEIDFYPEMLDDFNAQQPKGIYGDKIGIKKYNKVENKSLLNWKNSFYSYFRIKYAIHYISSFDENMLKVFGYNKMEIIEDLRKIKIKKNNFLVDLLDVIRVHLIITFKLNIFLGKSTRKWAKKKFLS